jgi:hypothetical protein
MTDEEIPEWCRAPERRYGLLCLAPDAHYIKDRR